MPDSTAASLERIDSPAFANGMPISARRGAASRECAAGFEVDMVAVNVPNPVPLAFRSHGGHDTQGMELVMPTMK